MYVLQIFHSSLSCTGVTLKCHASLLLRHDYIWICKYFLVQCEFQSFLNYFCKYYKIVCILVMCVLQSMYLLVMCLFQSSLCSNQCLVKPRSSHSVYSSQLAVLLLSQSSKFSSPVMFLQIACVLLSIASASRGYSSRINLVRIVVIHARLYMPSSLLLYYYKHLPTVNTCIYGFSTIVTPNDKVSGAKICFCNEEQLNGRYLLKTIHGLSSQCAGVRSSHCSIACVVLQAIQSAANYAFLATVQ